MIIYIVQSQKYNQKQRYRVEFWEYLQEWKADRDEWIVEDDDATMRKN